MPLLAFTDVLIFAAGLGLNNLLRKAGLMSSFDKLKQLGF